MIKKKLSKEPRKQQEAFVPNYGAPYELGLVSSVRQIKEEGDIRRTGGGDEARVVQLVEEEQEQLPLKYHRRSEKIPVKNPCRLIDFKNVCTDPQSWPMERVKRT